MIKLIDGGVYKTENGDWVKVRKNHLPYYKFSAEYIIYNGEVGEKSCSEKWTEDGIAYHRDCGFNIVE